MESSHASKWRWKEKKSLAVRKLQEKEFLIEENFIYYSDARLHG